MLSTSSPTYPASVIPVASQIANGRSRYSAILRANIVLPQPVGPNNSTLVFSNLMSLDGLLMRLKCWLTATLRAILASSCPITNSSRYSFINAGLRVFLSAGKFLILSSLSISEQRSIQSLHIAAFSPTISFSTSSLLFPQKSQLWFVTCFGT